ncbi:phage late control D family protein [Nitrospira sp. Nam80]
MIKDILSVSYKENIQELDSFDITINNWDAAERTFKYSDANLFDPGKELELWMGYYGTNRLRLMVKGEITSLRPSFPSGGGSTLTISGLNTLYKFKAQQESRIYENLTDTQIARQIGARLGIEVEGEDKGEEKFKYLIQDNQYDIIFLMERARRIGYDLFIDEPLQGGKSVLKFKRSTDVRRLSYNLTYGTSLIEFQPELTTANQVGKVTVRGWDPLQKKKIEFTATRAQIVTKGVGVKGGQPEIDKSFENKIEVVATKPVESESEARTLATQILEGIAKEMVKGTGSTVGLPDLRAGVVLELKGLGSRFSGRYFVVSTTHTIADSGYTTQFECRREEL